MADRSLKRGVDEAKKNASQGNRSFSRRTPYFSLDADSTEFVRFVTDFWEWPSCDMHMMMPTKPAPADATNWPKTMGSVCRLTEMGDGLPMFETCYLHDKADSYGKVKRPSTRHFALGILREEVKGDGSEKLGGDAMKGKRLGFRDKKRNVPKVVDGKVVEGETEDIPDIRIFNMGWQNFFGALEGSAQVHETVLDRDYAIRRIGTGLDTKYTITGLDKTDGYDLRDPETAIKYGIKIDMSKVDEEGYPEKVYPEEIDLGKIIENQASDEWLAQWFKSDGTQPSQVDKPSGDVSPDAVQAMHDRIIKAQNSVDESGPAGAINFND